MFDDFDLQVQCEEYYNEEYYDEELPVVHSVTTKKN